jgi:hypothetical protein
MSNAINPAANDSTPAVEELDFDMFKSPEPTPTRSLRGTGPRGVVRDDRLVADADNRAARRSRR